MRRLLLLGLLALALPAVAQTALVPDQPLDGDLEADGSDAYTLTLDAEQFVLGHAFQHTVDVVVTVAGPDGTQLRAFDDPRRGPELFQFTTDAAGDYTVTVTPFLGATGAYSITLDRVEAAATTPQGIVRQQFAALDRDDSPGAVVAVLRRGEVVFGETFGQANLTHGVPYTLDTPANIGSTSKQFTAMAVLLLAQRGDLDLDDDVREHIPELKDFGQTVTIRNLLTHTSGYREFLNLLDMTGQGFEDETRPEQLVEIVQRQPELQDAPGTVFNYNNTGYGLAAQIVERVSGQSFPDFIREAIFEPLGMTNSTVRADPTMIIPGRAEGYLASEDGGWREARDLGAGLGASAVYTTARDLAKWMDNYRTATVGGPDAIRELTTPYVLADGDSTDYGLGLFLDEWRGLERVQHGGSDTAHRSLFWYFPEIESGLVIHTNSPSGPGSVTDIAQAYFADHLAPEEEAGTGDFDPADFDPESFDAFAGTYDVEQVGLSVTFRREGDRYYAEPTGQPEAEITPIGPARFFIPIIDAELSFDVEADGSVETMTLHQGPGFTGRRVEVSAEAAPLADYVGRYYSDEIETFYTVALEDGALSLSTRRMREPVTLSHANGDAFTGGRRVTGVAFERDAEGAVTGFSADNAGRVRGVAFQRAD